MSRESTVKLLEALKGAKTKRVADLRNAEIATALEEVVAKVSTAISDVSSRRAWLNSYPALKSWSSSFRVVAVKKTTVHGCDCGCIAACCVSCRTVASNKHDAHGALQMRCLVI